MPKPIVILGVFVADTAYRAARQPRLGETILGERFTLGPGGKGSNQAVAAARAGGPGGDVRFLTRLGRDAFGDLARRTWAEAGVTPAAIASDGATGAAFIFLESGTGQNAIIICPGVAGDISEADIDAHAGLIRSASVFVTQLEQPLPAALRALQVAREAGVTTVLNPAPAAVLPTGTLALCDLVTPNEGEAAALAGLPVTTPAEAEAAARALRSQGAGAVVVTLGANGALWHDAARTIHVPSVDAGPVVETTGAGDAFNGALAVALSEGMAPEAALRFANAAAGLSVTRAGTAPAMPTRAEIDALLGQG